MESTDTAPEWMTTRLVQCLAREVVGTPASAGVKLDANLDAQR